MKPSVKEARFYAILDSGYVSPGNWAGKCRDLIEGGADIIQLRAKTETHRQRADLLDKIRPLFSAESAPILIVNDDLELCLQYPEIGLHIGQEDTSVADARKQPGPDRILGLSTHSIQQAEQAIHQKHLLDYFAVGPVFATQTKPGRPAVGLALVQEVSQKNPPLPFFCIGGIHRENAIDVLAAGATRLVAVSDVLCDPNTAQAVATFQRKLVRSRRP